jgi:predicted phosphodiesterase
MSRVAVIADIHGNLPALEAVVRDIEERAVDEVLVGGDLVGRGPEGSRVVQRIRQLGWQSVRGNHEDYLLTFRAGEVPPGWLEAEEWSASRWMAAELRPEDVRLIAALPFSLASKQAPRLRLVHASPRSTNDAIGPWTSQQRLEEHLGSVAEPTLVCGHTHRPLQRKLPLGEVVNVGSVGLPFNGDRRAQYVIFEAGEDGVRAEFRQVDYDLEEILAIYESSGFLAAGGVTARLLKMELQCAQPYLVPFLHWTEAREITPEASRIAEFCEFYDPDEPFRSFFCRLRELSDHE